ncbi:hypothetical protein [Euzebya rosea]|uniref:hypothetical protein n=1 Tax=Euzebya rosea TaxID=2052804 RepID=UPI00130099A5|nr:hypothetical protein [Euzebya rosea]
MSGMTSASRSAATGSDWVVELPDGWLPAREPDPPAWTDRTLLRATAPPLARLLEDDRAAGAASTTWSPAPLAEHGILATHSVLLADPGIPADAHAVSPDQDVVLPYCRGTMSVVVAMRDGHPILVVTHRLDLSMGHHLVLVGRTPNVTLADEFVRLFHLVAASAELVA